MKLLGRWKDATPTVPVPEPPGAKAFSGTSALVQSFAEAGPWPWLGAYGAAYLRQPAVRSVVDFLARNIASLNVKVYERKGDTDRVELDDHPLAVLLRNPNPRTTRYRLLRDTVSSQAIYDRAYWLKIRRGPDVVAISHIPPPKVALELVPNGANPTYTYRIGERDVSRDDLVIFSGFSPEGGEVGVSPLETLRQILAEDTAAVRHRAGFWRNAARQHGTIERPLEAAEWSDPARARFRADWEATFSGEQGSGRTAILEDGMKWNPSSFSPKDSLYVEGRELTYREVAMAFFGPVTRRQWLEATGAGTVENHRQLYQDVFGPWLAFLQDDIELQLLPEVENRAGRVYVEFNLAEKLKGSFEEQAKTLVSSVGVPFAAVNEARARMNLPRIDDPLFDVPVQPLNVLYGGQPAVTVPTATPGTPEPPAAIQAAMAPPPAIPLPTHGVKAAPAAAVRRRDAAADAHTEMFRRFFNRQGRVVMSLLGAALAAKHGPEPRRKVGPAVVEPVRGPVPEGTEPEEAPSAEEVQQLLVDLDLVWQAERWNEELSDEIYGYAVPLAQAAGNRAAAQIGGIYELAVTIAWLWENAQLAAGQINEQTVEELQEIVKETAEVHVLVERVRKVFEAAEAGRSEQLGMSRATTVINWSRNEAGRQSVEHDGRPRIKVWVVTSPRSRHAQWNGDTALVGHRFPNGADHPGDYRLGADQVAGCRCLMDLRRQ